MVKIKLDYLTSYLNVGYTVEWNFYLAKKYKSKKFNENIEIVFYQDYKKLEVIIPVNHDNEVIILMFEYDSISFINICNNNYATLGYKYPPKIYKAKRYMRNSYQDRERIWKNEDIVDNVINGTAINFTLQKDEILNQMMRIFNIEITDQDFNVLHNPVQLRSVHSTNNFYEAAVISLGFPGLYLLNYYTHYIGYLDDLFLERIYYHVKNDSRLPTIKLLEYSRQQLDDFAYVLIKSVTITPTRILVKPPTWKASSYGLRHIDTDKVLSVDFRDENGRCIRSYEEDIIDVIINNCKEGLKLGYKTYNELFCSSSKFREHSSFFYEGGKREILTILKSLGEFEPALPAKLGARIGLNSSSVRQGIVPNSFKIVEDVMSQGGQYNFTDGCGQISMDFAKKLSEHLNLEYLPSAFQIRFPGFKGVLLVSNSKSIHGYDIIFRKSQQKFRGFTDNETLDIITQSHPIKMSLNKSFIEVLIQNAAKTNKEVKKKIEKRIMEFVDISILEIIDNCINPDKFVEKLEKLPKYMSYKKMKSYSNVELLAEPFLRRLVQSDSLLYLKNMYEKNKVAFPQEYGRQMIGVPDFDGYLKPGQVFIQYSVDIDPLCEKKNVVKGKVAITRSPQYNLGDIRFVEAVDVPELHHISDVIVFPIVGDRPLQDRMSGGDLDGDEYAVFWDPELMLPRNYPAVDFTVKKPDNDEYVTIDEIQDEYLEFRREYMKNDFIGQYSNNHTTLAEHFGYDNTFILKLAEKLDVQVNYFKSGILAEVLEKDEQPSFYPEHMRKDHRPMYRLDNLLSKIYTIGEGLYLDVKDIIKYDNEKNVYLDPLIDIQNWNLYSDKAKKFYNSFKSQVDRIQIQYGIKDVNELFSGKVTEFLNRITHYIHDKDSITSLHGIINNNIQKLMKEFRKYVLKDDLWKDDTNYKNNEKLQKFAVACYKIAYQDRNYLPFAWIMWDVIDHVRQLNKQRHAESLFWERVFDDRSISIIKEQIHNIQDLTEYSQILSNFLFRIFYHLNISSNKLIFNEMFDEFKLCFLTSKINFGLFEDFFDDIIKFISYYGFVVYNEFIDRNGYSYFIPTCRELYLTIAFKLNPQIFKNDMCVKSNRYFRIVLDVHNNIYEEMFLRNLKRRIPCDVDIRANRTKNYFIYCLIAYGSKASIQKLKDLFILTNVEKDSRKESKNVKMDRLTRIVKDIERPNFYNPFELDYDFETDPIDIYDSMEYDSVEYNFNDLF